MKKLVSFLTLALIVFLCASMIIPVSAADEKVNLLAGAELAEIHGIKDHADYKPEHLFDNSTIYTGQKDSYCDFSLACSKEPVVNGTAPRYNLFGETDKEDSLYLMSFQVRLATPAEAGSFQFFGLDNTNLDLDGFDVWVSETGETGSYVKIFSGTHLWCDGKYDTIVTDNLTTTTITCTFDTMKVGYLAFGVTEPRCQHAEKGNVSPYPHYMRITELALYAPEAAATTALGDHGRSDHHGYPDHHGRSDHFCARDHAEDCG